jgi:hypothetical protein
MNRDSVIAGLLLLAAGTTLVSVTGQSAGTVQVHMVVTVEPQKEADTTVPVLSRDAVRVRQGKNTLTVNEWIPARGEQAAMQMFILIDDTSDTSLGLQFDEMRAFIEAQPTTTAIGLGYMRNTGVNIVQNLTNDHALVSKALRLTLGSTGASDSPYLSVVNLVKGWPESKVRRQLLMITDGIDRLRAYSEPSSLSPMRPGLGRPPLPYISPDVDRASRDAQRAGILVHSIYTRGVGHFGRSYFEITNGQNGLSKLADETGGETFMLGVQNAVSFKPYLDRLQRIIDNQYYLVFEARPGKKSDLQRVRIDTETPGLEIMTADNVWVPTPGSAGTK